MSDYLRSSEYQAKDSYEIAISRLYDKKFGGEKYGNLKGCFFHFLRNQFIGIVREIELFEKEDTEATKKAFDLVLEVYDYVKDIENDDYERIYSFVSNKEFESKEGSVYYKFYLLSSCLSKVSNLSNGYEWHLSNECYRILSDYYSKEEKSQAKVLAKKIFF